jgi:flagellar hook assembly protein FlgD
VGGFYVLSATEFDAGEIEFEIFDNSGRLIHKQKQISDNGSISITWGAKLNVGTYLLSVTASKNGKQITESKSF